ncbi:MAG: glycosyltransferase family 2 protein [Patescibacteria group bacterium]
MTIVVVIPAFNESRTIAGVLQGCRGHAQESIVVDDGSWDDTALRAREQGAVVFMHLINRGYGAALRTGIEAALKRGADIIVTIDADGQHEPAEIKNIIEPLKRGGVDMVIGNRFSAQSTREGMSVLRKLFITAGNILTWMLYGVWFSDTQSGFRAYTRQALEKVIDVGQNFRVSPREFPRESALQAEGMEFSSEVIGEAMRRGLTITTIPITIRYTNYSLAKGQNFFEGVRTALRLFARRLLR